MEEKRAAPRCRLNLPTLVSWIDGEKHTRGGFTRDISTEGAFVLCRRRVPGNAAVEIEILLPASSEVPGTLVRAKARVVRVHGQSEPTGFAVEGSFGESDAPDEFTEPTVP
jgi:PilZ domain-containing protein